MSILLLFWLFLLHLPAIRSMPLPGSLKTHLALFRYSWQWACHVLVWSSMADCMSSNSFYQAGFTEPSNSCITSPFSGFENLIKTIPYKTWVPCLPLISPLLTSAFSCWINKEVLHCCHPHNSILRTHTQNSQPNPSSFWETAPLKARLPLLCARDLYSSHSEAQPWLHAITSLNAIKLWGSPDPTAELACQYCFTKPSIFLPLQTFCPVILLFPLASHSKARRCWAKVRTPEVLMRNILAYKRYQYRNIFLLVNWLKIYS